MCEGFLHSSLRLIIEIVPAMKILINIEELK